MEEEKDTMSPVWRQDGSANGRRLRRTNSIFFNSGALLIFLLVTALAFIFIIAPTLHSFTSHIFKPHSVKRTWDSLNLVLVLFAILCGFLSRKNNNNTTNEETPRSYSYQDQSFSVSDTTQDYTKPNPETETQSSWYEYEYSDRTGYSYKSFNRLRSINSYPDLRQESSWVNSDERWRFYDDTHVNGYQDRWQIPVTGEEEKADLSIKNFEVDTFDGSKKEVPSVPPPLPAVAPPSPPPPPHGKDVGGKGKRTYQAVGKAKNNDLGAKKSQPPLPSTPSPPPPTEKTVKEKNRSKSATKEFLTSLKGKKKKQRHRSLENFESILNYSKPHTLPSQPPPPPPPPSVFESLFSSKKMKHKKPHISSSKTEAVKGATTLKPRLGESFYTLKENVSAGNESPLNIPMPPPPPFNMPAWKFKVKGDFVRIDSNSSSSSDLPDLEFEEVVESPKASSEVNQCNSNDGGEPEIPLFYPSPDVDTKAHTFIEKFRAGLRMEKMNSTKSNLGPSINTETKEEAGPSSRYKAVYVL